MTPLELEANLKKKKDNTTHDFDTLSDALDVAGFGDAIFLVGDTVRLIKNYFEFKDYKIDVVNE
jgi:hypothetical protein